LRNLCHCVYEIRLHHSIRFPRRQIERLSELRPPLSKFIRPSPLCESQLALFDVNVHTKLGKGQGRKDICQLRLQDIVNRSSRANIAKGRLKVLPASFAGDHPLKSSVKVSFLAELGSRFSLLFGPIDCGDQKLSTRLTCLLEKGPTTHHP